MFAIDPPTVPANLDPPAIVAAADAPRPRIDVSTASLPRFDSVDTAASTSRIGVALLPQRRSALGLAFGVSSLGGVNKAMTPWAANASSVDYGIHWRVTLDSSYRFDVTAYRYLSNADAISLIENHDPSYGARLELGMGSLQGHSKGFVADRGFLGFQLEGGARLMVRRSHRSPMLYYRNTF